MGGPATCNFMISGTSAQDAVTNGWKHMQEAHADQAEKIKSNSKEENDKWMAEFSKKWDALPEM